MFLGVWRALGERPDYMMTVSALSKKIRLAASGQILVPKIKTIAPLRIGARGSPFTLTTLTLTAKEVSLAKVYSCPATASKRVAAHGNPYLCGVMPAQSVTSGSNLT